ncbi:hypothetical protein MPER_10606, partial [Moniliophthora perniciosa FA553]
HYWVKAQALYFGVRCKQPHFVPVPIYPQVRDPPIHTINHVAIGYWVPELDQCGQRLINWTAISSQGVPDSRFTAVVQPNAYLADADLNTLAVETWAGGHKVLGPILVLKRGLDTPGIIDVMDGDVSVIMQGLKPILLEKKSDTPFPPILGLNPSFPITPAPGLLSRAK